MSNVITFEVEFKPAWWSMHHSAPRAWLQSLLLSSRPLCQSCSKCRTCFPSRHRPRSRTTERRKSCCNPESCSVQNYNRWTNARNDVNLGMVKKYYGCICTANGCFLCFWIRRWRVWGIQVWIGINNFNMWRAGVEKETGRAMFFEPGNV